MNVFEELVVELQEENLLEKTETMIESHSQPAVPADIDDIDVTELPDGSRYLPPRDAYETAEPMYSGSETMPAATSADDFDADYDTAVHDTEEPVVNRSQPENWGEPEAYADVQASKAEPVVSEDHSAAMSHEQAEEYHVQHQAEPAVAEPPAEVELEVPAETAPQPEQPQDRRVKKGKEFFKKRAMGEVSSLQMVEHVLTGVEREYLKVMPRVYDDFNAKKALNIFLQVAEGEASEEHASAEFTLMQETESWCTALANRDRDIPVSSLRQYCERSRPALSSQALLALGRFYRNLPYNEAVRSKFDFVITRLFSRAVAQEKRVCLFTRDETLGHINTLYSDWSSIPLYTVEDDESKVMLTALSFEDLAIEAENASVFDQLIESDFFGRLRMFKESISELFYAPQVTAAAIDCNIRIGNAYVELIDRERRRQDVAAMHTKFENIDEMAISEATGRSLGLEELLQELTRQVEVEVPIAEEPDDEPEAAQAAEIEETPVKVVKEGSFIQRLKANAFSVNRWFLALAVLIVIASIGLYSWANFASDEKVSTAGVSPVEIENTKLQEHLRIAKISGETLYGQLLPSWDVLPKEKRQEFVQLVLKAAQEKGCTQVNLISKDGKAAAYASATKMDIIMPGS